MEWRFRFLALCLMLILTPGLLGGCGSATRQHVWVDVIPTQKSEQFEVQVKKLGALLSEASGLDVRIRIATDYAAVVEALRFGKTDVAYLGPFTYVVANAQSGANAFVTMSINGRPYYHSYAIARHDFPAAELDDAGLAALKGRRVALGDPSSTSGAQIPQLALMKAGLDRERDVALVFTGAHDAVLKTVAAGKADIGFLDSAIFEGSLSKKFPADYARVRVVWRSAELYQYPWAHRKDLDPEAVARLRDAFLSIKDPEALEPFGADAFVEADDSKYDPVRAAAAALGVDLRSYIVK